MDCESDEIGERKMKVWSVSFRLFLIDYIEKYMVAGT